MESQKTSFKFEIDILPEKQDAIMSPIFASSSGCEWYVVVSLNGGNLSMDLFAESLRPASVIRAIWRFRMWDTSGIYLYASLEECGLFGNEDEMLGMGRLNMLSLSEKKKLIIQVEVKVVEVVHKGEETINVNGFQVLHTQVSSVTKALAEYPDIIEVLGPEKQLMKRAYMNILLDLLETMRKPRRCVSETELNKAYMEWSVLNGLGLKLERVRLDLEWKRKGQVNKLKCEVKAEKSKSSTALAKVLSLEQMVSDLKVELDKERAKSATSNVVSLLKDAFCFSYTKILGFRERRDYYQLLLPS